jgi:hypothetical protein
MFERFWTGKSIGRFVLTGKDNKTRPSFRKEFRKNVAPTVHDVHSAGGIPPSAGGRLPVAGEKDRNGVRFLQLDGEILRNGFRKLKPGEEIPGNGFGILKLDGEILKNGFPK